MDRCWSQKNWDRACRESVLEQFAIDPSSTIPRGLQGGIFVMTTLPSTSDNTMAIKYYQGGLQSVGPLVPAVASLMSHATSEEWWEPLFGICVRR